MADAPPYGHKDTSFKAAGQKDGILKLVRSFYKYMSQLEEAKRILQLHPDDLEVSIDKLYLFLCGWLGGPKAYREKYGPIRIPIAHRHIPIGTAERDAWMLCMTKAVSEQDSWRQDFKDYFLREILVPANRVINQEK